MSVGRSLCESTSSLNPPLNGESYENGGEKDRELWSKLDKRSS